MLDSGAFRWSSPQSLAGASYCFMLDTALEVAKGMAQIHSLNIIHMDLKVGAWRGGVKGEREASCSRNRTRAGGPLAALCDACPFLVCCPRQATSS